MTNSPGIDIERSNCATVVHRDPNSADGIDVLETVELWSAVAGSAQVTVMAKDVAGKTLTAAATCTVAHDRSKDK